MANGQRRAALRGRVGRRLPPALRRRDFRRLWVAVLTESLAMQMLVVAVGWQVYSIRRNPLDLGLVGLAEFLPLPLLALPAGQLADRLSRRLIFVVALVIQMVVALGLLVVSLSGADRLWPFFVLAAGTGVVTAIGAPASRALAPELVPIDLLASALALRSVAGQAAVVTGPAIGGLLFVLSPEVTYGTAAVLLAAAVVAASGLGLRATRALPVGDAPGLAHLLGGIAFLRRSPIVLGAIALDLFAVLLGGAVALLPVFARDILHVGPIGLGVLRTGPAIGALLAGLLLARRPLGRFAGRKLLVSVAIFGAAMVVFGLSRSLPLSLAALAVGGFVDMVSVNVRATAVALATPDELRGRVNAVEMVFISASNELGAFESGVAAAVFGTVRSVVAGGALTVAIALSWFRAFPALARVDRLEDIRPPRE